MGLGAAHRDKLVWLLPIVHAVGSDFRGKLVPLTIPAAFFIATQKE